MLFDYTSVVAKYLTFEQFEVSSAKAQLLALRHFFATMDFFDDSIGAAASLQGAARTGAAAAAADPALLIGGGLNPKSPVGDHF